MNEKIKAITLSWSVELLAILVSIVLLVMVMMPIFKDVPDYPFMIFNIAAIFAFFTLARYIFLLRYAPFARFMPIKLLFLFLAIPLLVFLMDGLSMFQNYLDEEGTYSLVSHLDRDRQVPLSKYIRTEVLFFSVGAIITTIIFPFRMIVSIWRSRNRNTV